MTAEAGPGLPAIRTRGLTKRYGAVMALDSLDLDIPSGTVFGLLGPNGAGKTTTIRLLAGLAQPTAGSAAVDGIDLTTGDGDALRRRIGVLDQDPRFYGWMTGRELLEFAGRLFGITGTDLRARVNETLELIGLSDAANRRIGGYSGGMRQRLGIGQALVGRPAILILDEPVSSLDPEGRRDLLALIAKLRATSTVLFSTHVLADVERICDRVAILDYGRLVTESPMADLLSRYAPSVYRLEPEPGQDSAVARLAERLRKAGWSRGVIIEADRILVYVSDPERAGREILPIVTDCDVRLSTFERVRPTLEDVFLRLVGREREPAADS